MLTFGVAFLYNIISLKSSQMPSCVERSLLLHFLLQLRRQNSSGQLTRLVQFAAPVPDPVVLFYGRAEGRAAKFEQLFGRLYGNSSVWVASLNMDSMSKSRCGRGRIPGIENCMYKDRRQEGTGWIWGCGYTAVFVMERQFNCWKKFKGDIMEQGSGYLLPWLTVLVANLRAISNVSSMLAGLPPSLMAETTRYSFTSLSSS